MLYLQLYLLLSIYFWIMPFKLASFQVYSLQSNLDYLNLSSVGEFVRIFDGMYLPTLMIRK